MSSLNDFASSLRSSLPKPDDRITDDPEKYSLRGSVASDKLYFVLKPDDLEVDEENRVYALKITNSGKDLVRFRVTKCSTVFFVAVLMKASATTLGLEWQFPHFGLVVENDFEVTEKINGVSTTTKIRNGCLVAHAMFVQPEYSTKLLVALCANRDDAFNQLALVGGKNCTYQRAMSPGFVSSMACFQLVEKLKAEIRKPFDKEWDSRLSGKSTTSLGDVTNCATFAVQIFYSLAPDDDKEKIVVEGMKAVFKRFEMLDKAAPYLSALKK